MTTFTVPRSTLQAAIEAGIANACAAGGLINLQPAEQEALRRVGREAKEVAAGGFVVGGCGCPATQAKLWPYERQAAAAVGFFAGGFDDALGEAGYDVEGSPGIFEIED